MNRCHTCVLSIEVSKHFRLKDEPPLSKCVKWESNGGVKHAYYLGSKYPQCSGKNNRGEPCRKRDEKKR